MRITSITPKLVARSMVATVAVQAFHLLRGVSIARRGIHVCLLMIVERLPPGDECEGCECLRLELKGKTEVLPEVSRSMTALTNILTCTIAYTPKGTPPIRVSSS